MNTLSLQYTNATYLPLISSETTEFYLITFKWTLLNADPGCSFILKEQETANHTYEYSIWSKTEQNQPDQILYFWKSAKKELIIIS